MFQAQMKGEMLMANWKVDQLGSGLRKGKYSVRCVTYSLLIGITSFHFLSFVTSEVLTPKAKICHYSLVSLFCS